MKKIKTFSNDANTFVHALMHRPYLLGNIKFNEQHDYWVWETANISHFKAYLKLQRNLSEVLVAEVLMSAKRDFIQELLVTQELSCAGFALLLSLKDVALLRIYLSAVAERGVYLDAYSRKLLIALGSQEIVHDLVLDGMAGMEEAFLIITRPELKHLVMEGNVHYVTEQAFLINASEEEIEEHWQDHDPERVGIRAFVKANFEP